MAPQGLHLAPIGRQVYYWRNFRNMSQEGLAFRLGKTKSWIEKIEAGKRRLDRVPTLYAIADALKIDPWLLLGRQQ